MLGFLNFFKIFDLILGDKGNLGDKGPTGGVKGDKGFYFFLHKFSFFNALRFHFQF